MAANPAFAVTPRCEAVSIGATANTARDGSGTTVVLIQGVTSGTRVAEVIVQATTTTTAGMVRLFINDGTTSRMFDEVSVAAATVSATTKGTRVSTLYSNLVLANASQSLRVSTHNADGMVVTALGADL
jgi:hypothetical protein